MPGRSKPPASGTLPAHGRRILAAAYESAKARAVEDGNSETAAKRTAAPQAWCAVKRHYFKRGSKWVKRKVPLGPHEQPPGCTPYRGGRRRNPEGLSPEARRVLERLADKAQRSGDDWGTITSIDGYLDDPDHDESPIEYLRHVDNDVEWHLKHVGMDAEDKASAKRAHQQIADAIAELEGMRAASPLYAQALEAINRDRARRGDRPLDPRAAGWTEDDVLAEAARISAKNPRHRRNPGSWTRGKVGSDHYGNLQIEYRRGARKAKLTFYHVSDPGEIDQAEGIQASVEGHQLEQDIEDPIWFKSETAALAKASHVADLFDQKRVSRYPARGEAWEPYLEWFKTQQPNQADYVILLSTNDPNGVYDNLLLEPLEENERVFKETFEDQGYAEENPSIPAIHWNELAGFDPPLFESDPIEVEHRGLGVFRLRAATHYVRNKLKQIKYGKHLGYDSSFIEVIEIGVPGRHKWGDAQRVTAGPMVLADAKRAVDLWREGKPFKSDNGRIADVDPKGYSTPKNPDDPDEDEDEEPTYEELRQRYRGDVEYENPGEDTKMEIIKADDDFWIAEDIHGYHEVIHEKYGRKPTKKDVAEMFGQGTKSTDIRSIKRMRGWFGRYIYDPGSVSEWVGPFATEQDAIDAGKKGFFAETNPGEIWVVVAPEKHQWPIAPLQVVTRENPSRQRNPAGREAKLGRRITGV